MPARLPLPLPLVSAVVAISCAIAIPSAAAGQQNVNAPQHAASYIAELFRSANFDRLAAEGRHDGIQWKVRTLVHGLSIQQRMVAHIEIDVPGSELIKRAADGQLIALAQVEDAAGHRYRDFGFIDLKQIKPELRKRTWESTWEAYALPGRYKVSLLLYDPRSREHSFIQTGLRVSGIRHDPFSAIWQSVPDWEFWAPLDKLPDEIYRPDIESPLHLVLAAKRAVQVDVLADLTPSDLFHGSSRFYQRYLSVALPLLKDLSQIRVANGPRQSLHVATLDLRLHKVTFEQDDGQPLNWTELQTVLAPENGPGMVNVQALEHRHETPDFLRDELLRRLAYQSRPATAAGSSPATSPATQASDPVSPQPAGKDFSGEQLGHDARGLTVPLNDDDPAPAKAAPSPEPPAPRDQAPSSEPTPSRLPESGAGSSASQPREGRAFRVFIIIGSPMDFYAFHHFPPIDPALAENCVVYYLQYENYGGYLNGALGEFRKMLKPLAIHTIKVRSAESVRQALARIVHEVDQR